MDLRRAFDEAATDFDRLGHYLWDPLAARTLAHSRPAPAERVLDACCGTGASALPTAELVGAAGSVDAVDISAEMISRLLEKARGLPQLRPSVADVCTWRGTDYDLVQSVMGIFFLRSMAESTTNLAAACRPGGRVCFTIWRRGAVDDAGRLLAAAREEMTGRRVEERPPHLVDELGDPDRYHAWLGARGLVDVAVAVEPLTVPMTGEAGWLTIVGSGFRGLLSDLEQPEQFAVRRRYETLLTERGPSELDATSLVGTGTWPGPPASND